MEDVDNICNILLTKRDIASEQLLNIIIREENSTLAQNLSIDERNEILTKKTQQRLLNLSSALLLKLGPSIKSILEQKTALENDSQLVTIVPPLKNPIQQAEIYKRMFLNVLNDVEATSFSCVNKLLLGNICERDLFILNLFTFLTCKRIRGDNVLQIYISGISSSGKSQIFESVIFPLAHNLVTANTSDGCGRFDTNGKSILFMHDSSIAALLSKDCDKIKAICRGETVTAKKHSTTITLEPLFVFVTSNERLLNHQIVNSKTNWPIKLISDANILHKNKLHHLLPIQNRFLEMHIRKLPHQKEYDLRNSDNFTKQDFILGLYPIVIEIMKKYRTEDFYTPYLYMYVIGGLLKHVDLYASFYELPKIDLHLLQEKYKSC